MVQVTGRCKYKDLEQIYMAFSLGDKGTISKCIKTDIKNSPAPENQNGPWPTPYMSDHLFFL